MRMRILLLLSISIGCTFAQGQLPETIVTSRSLVVMDLPLEKNGEFLVRGDWHEQSETIQKNLALMGVDAIAYLHAGDWNASPTSRATFKDFFRKREVTHLMTFSKNEDDFFELSIKDFDTLSDQWKTTGGSLNQTLFRLGKEIKKRSLVVENFLSPPSPDIVTDVPITSWTASTTFPGQIRRLTIGVAQFESEKENTRLRELLETYPYAFELFDYTDNEDAFRKGYQYVLLHMGTAGESIKKMLNYNTGTNETDYISTVASDSIATKLKTIPVEAFVHKFYLRHTVNHEAFVGRQWDADITWEAALRNFVLNLRIAFKEI